ncbi:MAG TPA: selenocysteine-specific translation elongation factor, partial [Kofleriaceae bacterium]|nr:selenocysteine-specific translation elongation factor [Kofleriaceae bacterium]
MSHPIVLGTAGHIDHGKTSLVRALTGIDTDRLPVEKARGITTELGFARLDLDGRRVAVVDVPGHERFVKSMVAGATGLDLVCLVIAADEGVMPQTREHLDICELLGVRRGLVVLTKSDLVDAEWLELVTTDVRAAVAQTFLATAPIVNVSAKTGAGMDALRAALTKAIDELPPRSTGGVFRLPIDRVFTVKGFGTIVTGTIAGGSVAVGDELVVLPTGLPARARGLEVHAAPVEHAMAGHRAAINLGGVAVDEIGRGDVLAHPGRVAASHILDVEIRHLTTAPGPLSARSKALVHLGTTQVLATIVLVGADELAPGATGLAQIRTDATTPLAALPGDHFILRGFTPTATHGSTIAGGRVIRVLAPKVRDGSQHAAAVASLAAARQDQRIALDVKTAAFAGLSLADLVRRLGVPRDALAAPLHTLVAGGELLVTGDADHPHYLHATAVAELEAKIVALVTAGDTDGVLRESLRTQLPSALHARAYDAIIAGLQRRKLVTADADRVRKATATRGHVLSDTEAAMLAKFESWGVEPLRPKELAAALGVTEPAAKT